MDGVGGKIYWRTSGDPNNNPEPPRIDRADLNGGNVEALLTTQSPSSELVVDTASQQLFWRDGWNILRAELNGAGAQLAEQGDHRVFTLAANGAHFIIGGQG